MLLSEWKDPVVREEPGFDASGVTIVMKQVVQLRIMWISAESI